MSDQDKSSKGLYKKAYPEPKRLQEGDENLKRGKKRKGKGERRVQKKAKLDEGDVERYKTKQSGEDVVKIVLTGTKKHKLYASKRVLCSSSKVLDDMMKGQDKKVITLNGKSLQDIVWLLNFIHSRSDMKAMRENQAVALLPFAIEYEMNELRDACISRIKKGIYRHPRLEFVTMAEKHNLHDLRLIAIHACASNVNYGELRKQKVLPENTELKVETYYEIYQVEQDIYGLSDEETDEDDNNNKK